MDIIGAAAIFTIGMGMCLERISSSWLTHFKPKKGWQCPLCKTVWSPDVKKCECDATARTRG